MAWQSPTIEFMVQETTQPAPDAIVIMRTSLASSSVAEVLTREPGIPVLDSVRVAVETSLALLDPSGEVSAAPG